MTEVDTLWRLTINELPTNVQCDPWVMAFSLVCPNWIFRSRFQVGFTCGLIEGDMPDVVAWRPLQSWKEASRELPHADRTDLEQILGVQLPPGPALPDPLGTLGEEHYPRVIEKVKRLGVRPYWCNAKRECMCAGCANRYLSIQEFDCWMKYSPENIAVSRSRRQCEADHD